MNSSLDLHPEYEQKCPLSETYTFLRFFIIVVATVISVVGTALNGLLIYLFCTKKQQAGTPATLYPTALAFLDFAICLEYILLFGVDAIVSFAKVESLFVLYYLYSIPVYVVAKYTQLAIPYMLIFATLERLVWTYGTIRSPILRAIYSKSGRIWTMVVCMLVCVLLRIPVAFSFEVEDFPLCQDFFRSKTTKPTQWAMNSSWYYFFDLYLMTIAQTVIPFLLLVFLNMVIVRKMGRQDSTNEQEVIRATTPSPSPSRILLSDDASPKTRKISALGLPLQSLKGMSPGVRSAVYTMTAIVTSYLISNTLHLILTALERYDHPWLFDDEDATLSSPFHTYFSDMMIQTAFRSMGGAANPFRHRGVSRPFSPGMILLVTLSLLPSLASAFFNFGGGGCGCPQPACPPPPPPPVCAPPPQPVCPPPSPCAVVHGAKTQNGLPITLPDELELRAAAFGVPVVHQSQQAPSTIDQLEKLVERYEPIETPKMEETVLAEPVSNHEADADLVRAGLRGNSEIRRSPTVVILHQEDATPVEESTTTTVASTTQPVKVKEEEATQNKCNSQVLHKLMLDNISDNSSESKRKINAVAEEKFGGNVDVVCSRGHFSYVFSSNLYCEATKGLTTCIAFRQAA